MKASQNPSNKGLIFAHGDPRRGVGLLAYTTKDNPCSALACVGRPDLQRRATPGRLRVS